MGQIQPKGRAKVEAKRSVLFVSNVTPPQRDIKRTPVVHRVNVTQSRIYQSTGLILALIERHRYRGREGSTAVGPCVVEIDTDSS